MRRVWYSFGIRTLSFAPLWYGVAFGVSLGLFRELVFVQSVVNNFLAVPVGSAPSYAVSVVANAIASGEFLTLISVLVMGVVTLSLLRRISLPVYAGRNWQLS